MPEWENTEKAKHKPKETVGGRGKTKSKKRAMKELQKRRID